MSTENEAGVDDGVDEAADNAEVEAKARELGWAPKSEWRGAEDKWIDAKTFVSRGERYVPFIKAENRKLKAEIESERAARAQLETKLNDALASIEELRTANSEVAKERAQSARRALAAELRQAREDNDTEKELEIQSRLNKLDRALETPVTKRPTTSTTEGPDPTKDPAFQQFLRENPWFNTDRRKTALAMGVAQELRESDPNLKGGDFFKKLVEEVDKTFEPTSARRRPSKVGNSRNGEGGGNDGAGDDERGWSDLPDDVKATARRLGKRLIGPGKTYKDEAAWQAHYAKEYFK
jgi:hypothetical protein